jgi:CubicO group peptidase (beta-lactamase class C family)
MVADSYARDNGFVGSVVVIYKGRVLLDRGYGYANLEWKIPNAPNVKFRIASLSKQFTAALILLLQQDGRLRIDDSIRKYLPDAPKYWDNIRLVELMGHTSGIPDFTDDKDFQTWQMSPHTHFEELARFRDRPLNLNQAADLSTPTQGSNCWDSSSKRLQAKPMKMCYGNASSVLSE